MRERNLNAPDYPQEEELQHQTADARIDIELTRTEMSSTIEAIRDKLDPEVLSGQAKETAHQVTDYAIREAKGAAREITENAITLLGDQLLLAQLHGVVDAVDRPCGAFSVKCGIASRHGRPVVARLDVVAL